VVLDTIGWSGGKSTLDMLACDPAVVTLPGRFMRGRHTAAILQVIGCAETVASSVKHYVALAVRLGLDPAWRAQVRRRVADRKAAAFGDVGAVRALEAFMTDAVGSRLGWGG
jgi:protein O-GlcNAc transferase